MTGELLCSTDAGFACMDGCDAQCVHVITCIARTPPGAGKTHDKSGSASDDVFALLPDTILHCCALV